MLIVIVGRSGAGKSTFVEALGLPYYHFVCSSPLIEEVKKRGLPLTHNTIFEVSQELYSEDRYWMIPIFQKELEKRGGVMIADGLRYLHSLKRLREMCEVIVVRIEASPEKRFKRLKARKKISLDTLEEFELLERDETEAMRIEDVLTEADLVIPNHVSLERLEERARLFSLLLRAKIKEQGGIPPCLNK